MKISSQMGICKMKFTVITLSAQQMKPYDLEFSKRLKHKFYHD